MAATPPQSPTRWWWLPLVVGLLGLVIVGTPLNAWLSRPLVDLQMRAQAPRTPLAGVAVVEIDDTSLEALRPWLGTWPYKRDVYALVIEQLRASGAKAIVLDLLLADEREGDAALARTLQRPGAPVVLAAAGLRPLNGDAARVDAMAWAELSLPAPSLWPQAGGMAVGLITTSLDSDARLRALPLWHEVRGQRWPSLPLAAWTAAHPGVTAPAWPLDGQGRVGIAFTADESVLPTLPFSELALAALQRTPAEPLAARLKDRVVFVGAGPMLSDRVLTPAGLIGGTAALAQAYAALRDQRTLRAPTLAIDLSLLLLAVLPAAVVGWRARLRPAHAALAAAALAACALAVFALLTTQAQLTQPAAALVAGVVGIGLALVAHQRRLLRSHERLRYERSVADAANQAKSRFLAQVSHEIRTPMHALLGVAELLAQSDLRPQQRRLVQMFSDAGRSLQALLGDLLDLSKIEAGRLEMQRADFALRPLLSRVAGLLAQRAALKGLAFDLQCADDLPHSVSGDAQRLEQALTNLLANAIKFTAAGRVALEVRRGDGDLLHFVVSDSGVGIAPSKLDTIFEPFAQADGSVARHYGGTGLGLTITRSVARLMGGDVTATSTPGTGSSFTLSARLPEAPPVASAPAAAAPVPAGLAGRRILLAEDHEVNVMIFRAMLDGVGLVIDVAADGAQALRMALAQPYDAVFADLQMPSLGGLAMTEELRRIEAASGRTRTPVVALTANAYAADIQRSLQAGCDLHLAKPYTRRQLLDALAWVAAEPQTDAPAGLRVPLPAELARAEAVARLGSADLYRRVCQHAAVFAAQWSDSYDTALAAGDSDRLRRLTHDLKSIAANVGADDLSADAAALERATPETRTAALLKIKQALPPVIAALAAPPPLGGGQGESSVHPMG
jgi:signal transduction histidine kinase/HPt (histidine-containing phosphotransfer) domain-containing protein